MPGAGKRQKARVAARLGAAEKHAVITSDLIDEFAQFREEILPAIRQDLKRGMSAKAIRQKYLALAAARQVSIALDPKTQEGTALAAIKDVSDRVEGKAKETQEITHKMKEVSDDQLDAMILSKLGQTSEQEKNKKH